MDAAAAAHIAAALNHCAHGERTAVADRLAAQYHCARATIYRAANDAGRRGTSRARGPQHPERHDWARTLAAYALPDDGRSLPLDLAVAMLVDSQRLPAEAKQVPIGTWHRLFRDLRLNQRTARTRRIGADYPNQAWQMDGSTSEYFIADHPTPDGDWWLTIHRSPMPLSGYKNKPVKPHRQRVTVYGFVDIASGARLSRYTVARGENAYDAMEAFTWAMGDRADDARLVLRGVPDNLWSDQGPIAKHHATRDLIERLHIQLVLGPPYQKTRMGLVERAWRTQWQRFEMPFVLSGLEGIRLSELNERLATYLNQENQRASRDAPEFSRADRWQAGVNARGGAQAIPANALATLVREYSRYVDTSGLFRLNHVEYELIDLHDEWVTVRHALHQSDGPVVVEDARGQRREVRLHRALGYGEHRGSPLLPVERARREGAAPAGEGLSLPYDRTEAGNVTRFPVRQSPAHSLPHPLETAPAPATVTEAMATFRALYAGPALSEHWQSQIQAHLQAQLAAGEGLDAARQLALEMNQQAGLAAQR